MKADGLAAGKGVFVVSNKESAKKAVDEMVTLSGIQKHLYNPFDCE